MIFDTQRSNLDTSKEKIARQLTCDLGFDELHNLGFLDVAVDDEEEENRTSIDTLEIEMARTTRHVALRWHQCDEF